MKLVLIIMMALSAKAIAGGSPFYTDINGVRYYCAPTNDQPAPPTPPPNNGGNVLDCINKAYTGPFSKSESEEICQGATSTAPADCALSAYAGVFSKAESITLCKGANSTGPALCAKKAYAGPFSRAESLELCTGRYATEATADCALRAYAGPYSKEDAIRICKSNLIGAEMAMSTSTESTLTKSDEQRILQLIKQNEMSAKKLQRGLDLSIKK